MLEINKIYSLNALDGFKQLDSDSIDLIITDPPYSKEFLYTYNYLADESPRVLKKGASLLTIVGHFAIPQVIKIFEDKLKFRWMLCMNQFDGSHARMAMGIEVMWKPMLWYVKDAYPQGRGFLRDGIKIEGKLGQNKKHHKWQQDLDWCLYYIKKLTKEGDLVLDPFIGSGTVAVACKMLNRKFIGFEIIEEYVKIANERLSQNTLKEDGLPPTDKSVGIRPTIL